MARRVDAARGGGVHYAVHLRGLAAAHQAAQRGQLVEPVAVRGKAGGGGLDHLAEAGTVGVGLGVLHGPYSTANAALVGQGRDAHPAGTER